MKMKIIVICLISISQYYIGTLGSEQNDNKRTKTYTQLKKTQKWLVKLRKHYSITRLENLTNLSLEDLLVYDLNLVHIKPLKNLKTLDLSGTRIRGNGLVHL